MQYGHENKENYQQLAVDCYTNSPCQHLGECMEKSAKNIYTDVRL